MQGPGRIEEMDPAERAKVGPSGQQDGVHVVVRGDRTNRDRRDADLIADPVGERGLV
jgi:hypothetical protein